MSCSCTTDQEERAHLHGFSIELKTYMITKHVGLCGILSLIVKSSVSSLEILLCLSSLFFVRKTCSLRYRKWLLIQIAIAVCNSSEFSIYGSKFPKAMAGGSMGG
mmetsp:Transcript_23335/g.75861  ORF Transcript_23335/g.75861 Transcript_23335/m.75861 type:complete len:105 (-) Transcript_23335:174-488(-)